MAKRQPKQPNRPGKVRPPRANTIGTPWIYGRHAAEAAIANPNRQVKRIVLLANDDVLKEKIEGLCRSADIPRPNPEFCEKKELETLVGPEAKHQGIAVLADPLETQSLEDIIAATRAQATTIIVVLDQATDPRNIGAVLRSAAAFDASAVILQDRHSPQDNGPMIKAASGAMDIVPIVRVNNIVRSLQVLAEAGFWSVGLDGHTDQPLSKIDTSGKCALVFGAEGSGLRRLVRETCDHLASIPISQNMESLNLSNAVAITLYEARRNS